MAITKKVRIWNEETKSYGEPVLETTHVGRVIEVFNRDHRAMSDVYTWALFAKVVTDKGMIETVMVNANFECDQSEGCAEVDAGPEVLLIKKFWDDVRASEIARLDAERTARNLEIERNRPVKGKRVTVVSGPHKGQNMTVAFVLPATGRVLLKKDDEWKNRKVDGVWVNCKQLQTRV